MHNRVCPGRFFAEETGPFVAILMLWAFQTEHVEGPARPEDVKWVDAMMRSASPSTLRYSLTQLGWCSPPLPFKLQFRPRTEKIRKLLENA